MEVIYINLESILKDLRKLVIKIGEYQLKNLNTDLSVKKKSSAIDLVSEIDKNSEKMIIEWIDNNFPKHNIIAEEQGSTDNDSKYTWVIYPLDVTTNYIHGFPIFSISIALMKDEKPILGLIYAPYLDELYYAIENKGAYLNEKRVYVSNENSLIDSLLVTGFPYDFENNKYNNIDVFNSLLFKSRGIRRIGSAAYDLAAVAAGRFDGFWEFKLNPWDVKAGVIIVKEAGGNVLETDYKGSGLIIAANNKINNEIMKEINKIYG